MQKGLIVATLCFLVRKSNDKTTHVCLAMKKRGFGVGRWNGVGGKVQPDESVEEAAKREAFEEIGVQLTAIEKAAEMTFLFPHKPELDLLVHVYTATNWTGEPTESEEMQPKWFKVNSIPYKEMWSDDEMWLNKVLEGHKIVATFSFNEKDVATKHVFKVVKAL